MNSVERFSSKARYYARYRWPFDPAAVERIVSLAGLSPGATAVDMAAGTGAVSRLLLAAGLRVIAVEPNATMRAAADQDLAGSPNYTSIDALSDDTGLPAGSVELITVGRALHWLPAEATRREMVRILQPGGWVAILSLPSRHDDLLAATRAIQTAPNGWEVGGGYPAQPKTPPAFYFGGDHYQTLEFPSTVTETWEQFFGRLLSYSSAPAADAPRLERLCQAAKEVFDRFAVDGRLQIPVATEVIIGQVRS